MKLFSYLILAVLLMAVGTPLVGAEETADPWGEPVATGIEYREYTLPDPVNVFVTRMERNNRQVILESSIGQGRLSGGGETVSGMAQRYDGALNYWDQTWGSTNQVAVAINGFYFGPPFEPAGVPWSGQVHSGWYSKRFTELESGSGLAWNLDRSLFIGECVSHPASKQQVHFYRLGSEFANLSFDAINIPRNDNEFILYTPQFDYDTGTSGSSEAIEVLVQLQRPSLIIPYSAMAAGEKGEVVEIRNSKGGTPIPFDHVVLSMHGTKKTEFLNKGVQVGDQVGISQKIKDCTNFPTNNWDYTYASIGGAFYFLKGGVIQDFSGDSQANVRDPRTAIAYNDDYIYFIVVDGRDELNSIGMTIPQLAQFARDELGATYGIAQDGGGSSTMVVNGEVKNNTYCNIVICKNRVFLPFVVKSGKDSQSDSAALPMNPSGLTGSNLNQPEQLSGDGLPLTEEYYIYAPDSTGDILQRLVANGMMMVVVQPKDQPNEPVFAVDDPIKTLTQVNVRLGPGTNYGLVDTVDADTTGKILGNDNGLNGIWAKGYYWWRVLLELPGGVDIVGWVIEPALTLNTNLR
ncbi:MAG: phosphodiester glycosidase family protein [Chloroflexota bacterium]|nr:MAG: phosphodiester glycosidase family protein [Chloroflexota bacterium]